MDKTVKTFSDNNLNTSLPSLFVDERKRNISDLSNIYFIYCEYCDHEIDQIFIFFIIQTNIYLAPQRCCSLFVPERVCVQESVFFFLLLVRGAYCGVCQYWERVVFGVLGLFGGVGW